MKKQIFLLIIVLSVVVLLVGCSQDEQTDKSSEEIGEQNAHSAEDVIKDYDQDDSQQGFSIQGKKYPFYNTDVLILNVQNQNDKNYTINITVDFLNSEGQTLHTEERKFEGFASNWQNYFVFKPKITFASYTCTLNVTEYNEIAYSKYFEVGTHGDPVRLTLNRTYFMHDPLTQELITRFDEPRVRVGASYQFINTSEEELYYGACFVLFDNKGNLYMVDDLLLETRLIPVHIYDDPARSGEGGREVYVSDLLWWEERDAFVYPEELTGEITGLVGFTWIDNEHLDLSELDIPIPES